MRMINPILNLGKIGLYEATYLVQCQSDDEVNRARQYFSSYPWVNVMTVRSNALPLIEEESKKLQIPTEVFNAMDESHYNMVANVLKTQQFDIIQIEHSWMSWVVPLIRTIAPDTPVVLDMHNIESMFLERWLQYDPRCDRDGIQAAFGKMQNWERETWQWYDACLAVSPVEAQEYREATVNRIPTWDLPTGGGIDTERLSQPMSRKPAGAGSVVTIGTLIWYPNVHGLIWFIDKVMPILKLTHPKARLYIAGFGGPWLELMKRIKERKDIVFLGEIADERELLELGSVFIAPLWIVAGARVKILTAWAAGIPVVATTLAAEGLHYTNHHDILIADDPQSFAEAIDSLFDSPELAAKLIENGRILIKKHYSLERAAEQYAQAYHTITSAATHPCAGAATEDSWVRKKQAMESLVKLKTELQAKASAASKNIGFPAYIRKLMTAADKALPFVIKKTYAYYLAATAFKTINQEGWKIFFYKAYMWLKKRLSLRKVR